MSSLVYLLLIWSFTTLISSVLVPLETSDRFQLCQGQDCLISYTNSIAVGKDIVLCFASFDITYDPYITYYVGWLLDIFRETSVRILVSDCNNQDCDMLSRWLMTNLPNNTIYTYLPHSAFTEDILYLCDIRRQSGFEAPILFHLNDEQPWNHQAHFVDSASSSLVTLDSQLVKIYNQFRLVLRNYYYMPLADLSLYVPLGPSYFGWQIGGSAYSRLKLASERAVWCMFSGRYDYDDPSPHHVERRLLWELAQGGEFPCTVFFGSESSLHTLGYYNYLKALSDTVFAPCPGGNNLETFRHYEVLELGAIPLFVKPAAEFDFTVDWVDYPGPIFGSWRDMKAFMASMDTEKASQLQLQVADWYQLYKSRTRTRLAAALSAATS